MQLFSGGGLVGLHLIVTVSSLFLHYNAAKYEKYGMDPMKRNLIDMVSLSHFRLLHASLVDMSIILHISAFFRPLNSKMLYHACS